MQKIVRKTYKECQKLIHSMKPHHKTVNEYYVQKLKLKSFVRRLDLFIPECEGKDVLHFGCTDWPIFNESKNLHIFLSKHAKSIDGFDIDEAGIENLRKYVDQGYYSDFDNLPTREYDLCLIPETIEHVDNIRFFLEKISEINAKKFLITAPNCFARARHENYTLKNDEFIEVVHPDHNVWFSPYTLKNVIEKYSSLEVSAIYLIDNGRTVCCEAVRKN